MHGGDLAYALAVWARERPSLNLCLLLLDRFLSGRVDEAGNRTSSGRLFRFRRLGRRVLRRGHVWDTNEGGLEARKGVSRAELTVAVRAPREHVALLRND